MSAAEAIGRLAPSPTGAQHVGNARTYLLAWLSARSQQGRIILRIEDIDSPRIKAGAAQQAIDDLRWLGLDWDEGPDLGGPRGPYTQTQRRSLYNEALLRLREWEAIYPCTCTRTDVEAAASAPHPGQEGPLYPGTCAHRTVADAAGLAGRPFCWRFRTSRVTQAIEFDDRLRGRQRCDLARELGDFVVAKTDGSPAYQLAVVVDDHDMNITEVIRGDDLVPSAFRQIALFRAFGWTPPAYAHVPLVVGPDGRRLAKRHGDTRISVLRDEGIPAENLVGFLAASCNLIDRIEPVAARDLIPHFRWDGIPREPLVFRHDDWNRIRRMTSRRLDG